ncbi:MAG TPA: hypothetical protein VEL28_10300, partial [Candidatus Binatia bacterium]|nr:hypothetical protein [Candidatus Binatia bacterium]
MSPAETSQTIPLLNGTGDVAALKTALETGGSAPGHHIVLANGSYTFTNAQAITMPAARVGVKRRPIVVRPATP